MVNKNNIVVKTTRRGNGGGPNIRKDDSSGKEEVMLGVVKCNLWLLLMLQELQEKAHECSSRK